MIEGERRAGIAAGEGEIAARRGRGLAYLALAALVIAGGLTLRPITALEENPQPLLQRAAVLRQAVAREPETPELLLKLARTEFRLAKLEALREYNERFPEGSGESLAVSRARYEAWLRGHLYMSPTSRRAQALARQAAEGVSSPDRRAEAYLLLGAIAWERGQEREAMRAFHAACRARPEWPPAWMRLSAAAAERGDTATVAVARRRLARLQVDPCEVPPVEP